MKTIESKQIGVLNQNDTIKDWWHGSPVKLQLIDQTLPVSFINLNPEEDQKFIMEADQALTHFLKLNSFYKLQIAQHLFENFVEYCSYVTEADIPEKMKGAQPLSIWNFIYPTAIFVDRRPTNDKDIYVILSCECEWDKANGLQLVFRQGKKLTRVSDQDGHLTEADAYDLPDSEDKLLSQF